MVRKRFFGSRCYQQLQALAPTTAAAAASAAAAATDALLPLRLLRAEIGGENRSWDVHVQTGGGGASRVLFAAVAKGRIIFHMGEANGMEICE